MAKQERKILEVAFATEAAFLAEYTSNICNGGIFIGTERVFALCDRVQVDLRLTFCEESVSLDGDVVHYMPVEMVQAGASPGVAIQFRLSTRELRRKFERFVGCADLTNERGSGSGRREAKRVRARMLTEVSDASGCAYDARTRDISRTGVLISAGARVPALGEGVSLNFQHPVSGEVMKVAGNVVRHLQTERGEVTALGIEFQQAGAQATRVGAFVENVKAAEHSRRLGAICGPIDPLGVRSILEMFASKAPHGTLTLMRGNEEGTIVLNRGALVAACAGARTGFSALGEMLRWDTGGFEFEIQLDAALTKESGIPLEQAMRRAESGGSKKPARKTRKARPARRTEHAIPCDAKVRVDVAALDAGAAALTKLEEAVIDLAIVGMQISKVVRVIPESEAEILDAIASLLEQGFVLLD